MESQLNDVLMSQDRTVNKISTRFSSFLKGNPEEEKKGGYHVSPRFPMTMETETEAEFSEPNPLLDSIIRREKEEDEEAENEVRWSNNED